MRRATILPDRPLWEQSHPRVNAPGDIAECDESEAFDAFFHGVTLARTRAAVIASMVYPAVTWSMKDRSEAQ